MIPKKGGRIINIASIAGLSGNPPEMQTLAYNTSKGAVISFTHTLAAEWGKYDINVNAICPGFFMTKMAAGADQVASARRSWPSHAPLRPAGRRRRPEGHHAAVRERRRQAHHRPVAGRRWRRERRARSG